MEMAADTVELAAQAVEMILKEGTAKAMNQFNRRNAPPEDAES
jgi:hypothetical protein